MQQEKMVNIAVFPQISSKIPISFRAKSKTGYHQIVITGLFFPKWP